MLAGYLECGLGFAGVNYEFIIELEFVTRGGEQLFILGLDANSIPESWKNLMWGTTPLLDHLNVEILTAENNNFTYIDAKNEHGGDNSDYFTISRALLAAVRSILVDTNIPWAPHYGIALWLASSTTQHPNHDTHAPRLTNKY